MPLEVIDLSVPPGQCVQRCANCDAVHTIRFDRGALETRPGPLVIGSPAQLGIRIDDGTPSTIPLTPGTLTPAALAALAATVAGINVALNGEALVIESATTGAGSRVELVAGPARQSLLGLADDFHDLASGRPVLGATLEQLVDENAIMLRRCGCGAQETLFRTWDQAPDALQGTRFDRHRRAVNALAQHFLDEGWVHPEVAATVRSEAPPDILALPPGAAITL